jgi:hypothetical protein
MKNIIKKNKILFLAIAIVLAGGICLSVMLMSQTHIAMAAEKIQTAEAEAAETAVVTEPVVTPTPEPTPVPLPPAVDNPTVLGYAVMDKEYRREFVIPSLDNTEVNEADTWKMVEPDDFEALKAKALPTAANLTKALFGYDMAEDAVDYRYYTDTSGHRDDFIRVFTTDEAVICTLAADTLELIEIDYYFLPDSEQMPEEFDYSEVSDSDRTIADSIAAVFDTNVSDVDITGGSGGNGIWTNTYSLKMKNGKLAQFAVMNGTLYAVGVYPSQASLQERVYFDADVQRDPSLVKLASEQNFVKGEPGAGDMTQDEAQSIYDKFLTLAGGDEQSAKPKMTFYIDNSGSRENYWQMTSKKLNMDIASKSKWIISLSCGDLYNPELDLTKIDYGGMGGQQYEDYVENIMGSIYGEGFLMAGVNAVYDDHYCTEDAWMADGSLYEFMFADGKLQQVMFFANEDCFRSCHSGWIADHEYINTATGEKFIPN